MNLFKTEIQYKKGEFTRDHAIKFHVYFTNILYRYFNRRWRQSLEETLKEYKHRFDINEGLLRTFILIKFDSETEMLESKNEVINFIKNAINKVNLLIQEDYSEYLRVRDSKKTKKENLKKINKYFDDESVDLTGVAHNSKITDKRLVSVITDGTNKKIFIKINELKDHFETNPNDKIENTQANLKIQDELCEALNVTDLSVYLYGNTYFSSLDRQNSNEEFSDQPQFKSDFTVKYDEDTGNYLVVDPMGDELAVYFNTKNEALEFMKSLSFKDGKTSKKIDW